MTIREFALIHRLRVNDKKLARRYRLSWAEDVVPGRYGELADFAERGEADFGLRLLAVPRRAVMTGALRNRIRAALAGGLRLKHRADSEAIFYFDPLNPAEASLAIRLVGANRKRQGRKLAPEQKAALAARLATARAFRSQRKAPTEAFLGEKHCVAGPVRA